MKKKMLLIVNPCSGKTRKRKTIDELISRGLTEEFDITVHKTRFIGDAVEVAGKRAEDFDIIACAGGDGTLNEVISGIMIKNVKKPIAYIPNGTTNDFAKVIGIPLTINGISSLISEGETNFCDVGTFNDDKFFVCTASFGYGVNASLSTSQKMKNNFGHLAYIMSALTKLTDIRPYSMEIECDGKVYNGDFIFGSITNTTSVGGVFKLKKDSVRLNDGKFEVILVPAIKSVTEVPSLLNKLRSQQYDGESIIFLQAQKIKIKSAEKTEWLIDGENAGYQELVEIINNKQAIELVCPKKKKIIQEKIKKI